MTRRNVIGTVYLLHFSEAYGPGGGANGRGTARHYTGWAADLNARLAEHEQGRGARLTAVAKAAGITWTLARTWPGTRARERQLKNQGGASRHCPDCKAESTRPQLEGDGKDTGMTTTDDKIRAAGDKHDAAIRAAFAAIPRDSGVRQTLKLARPAITAAREELEREVAAARAGFGDATRTVAAQYAAGADLDVIAAHHQDVSADLLSDAQTPFGRAYAREYSDTAATLVADLRQDQAVARGRSAAACTLPDGTPHSDPALAARGWQVQGGVYQRQVAADREAC